MEVQTQSINPLVKGKQQIWMLRGGLGIVALAALALLSKVIWEAASAVAGLMVCGVLALVGIALFQSMGLLAQKLENRILSARRAEARKYPIEQLQNYLRDRERLAASFKAGTTAFKSKIKSMQERVEQYVRERPSYDPTQKRQAIELMQAHYQKLETVYLNAEQALAVLRDKVEDQKFDYEIGNIVESALQDMNALDGAGSVEKLLANEAFDSIRTTFNDAFSALELEAARMNSTQQLSFGAEMIDVSGISVMVPQKVAR